MIHIVITQLQDITSWLKHRLTYIQFRFLKQLCIFTVNNFSNMWTWWSHIIDSTRKISMGNQAWLCSSLWWHSQNWGRKFNLIPLFEFPHWMQTTFKVLHFMSRKSYSLPCFVRCFLDGGKLHHTRARKAVVLTKLLRAKLVEHFNKIAAKGDCRNFHGSSVPFN